MNRFILVISACVALSACETSFPILKPSDVDAVRLAEAHPTDSAQAVAIEKAIAVLKDGGENPEDFFVGPVSVGLNGTLELPLYYKAAFEKPLSPGNPSGKSRTLIFDPIKKVVVKQLWWQ